MDPTRAALVVAAHEFVDPRFKQLRSPAQDVDALAGVLGDAAIGGFEVKTVVNQSSFVVQQELERFFAGRQPDDLLVLYFSCHGLKDPAGRLYFVTTNTTFDLLRSTGISAAFVSEQMEYSRSKRIVVLLDCCYSGAFLKGFRARGDDTVTVEQLEGRGRAVITASRATEYAFEADQLASENAQPSMFTGAIVEGLATGLADRDGDGLVTVDELYDYVYDAVRGKVAGQTPGRWIDVEGNLVVARNPKPPVRAAELPAELRRAVESDAALQRLGAVSELAQWYRAGDAHRQLAAATILDQLSRDYDERVKAAATAALSGRPEPPPPVVEPVPLSAPAAPQRVEEAVPEATVAADPVPEQPVPADARLRVAGWLAGLGGLGVLLAPYPTFLAFDGYTSTLGDREWFTLGAFAIFGLAGYAAHCLLRTTKSRATGLAVLTGLLPLALGHGLLAMNDLAQKDVVGPRPGWVLLQGGLLLVVVAAVLATTRAGRSASAPPTRASGTSDRGAKGMAAAALVVGAATSLGWARLFSLEGDGLLGVVDPVQTLVFWLLVAATLVRVGGSWIQAGGWKRRALPPATVVVLVALFLATPEIRNAEGFRLLAFAVLAVGAATLPAWSTVLAPRRLGAVLLASWVAASAAWLPPLAAEGRDATLLATALAAAAVLAAVLAAHGRTQTPSLS